MSGTKKDKSATSDNQRSKENRQQKEKKKKVRWIIYITLLGLIFSIAFNFLSQLASQSANVWAVIVILVFLLFINIAGDGIALATTACELSPLFAMAARKEKGAKTAIWLVKNSEKVSSVILDVLGDISGLLSGVFIVIITIQLFKDERALSLANLLLPALFGGIIISGKAIVKVYALKNPKRIVLGFSRMLEIFRKNK